MQQERCLTREHTTVPEPDPLDLRVLSSIMSVARPMSKVNATLIPHSRPRSALIGILPGAGGVVMSLLVVSEPTWPLAICAGCVAAEEGFDLQGQWQPLQQGQASMSLDEPAHLPHIFHLTCFGWLEMAEA